MRMKTEILNRRFLFFLLRFLIVAAIVLGLVVGVNYFIDASHVIASRSQEQMAKLVLEGSTVAVPDNYNERIFQVAVLARMPSIPETVVVGASRGMFLGSEITGFSNLYNSCVSGVCLEDYYALLGLYDQKFSGYPSRVVLEVSPWIFYSGNPETRWTEIYAYRTAAEKLYTRLNHKKPEIRAREIKPGESQEQPFYSRENPYFSLPYFQYNLEMLRRKGMGVFAENTARVSTDPSEAAEYPDGSIRYPASQENESEERLAKVRASSGAVTYEHVDRMTEIDPERKEAFESLVRDLLDHGTEVIFYLQPFSETQCRYSFDENLNPVFGVVESYLRELAEAGGIKVVGGYDARDFGLSDESFMDSIHPDRQATKAVWSAGFAE